MYAPHDMIMPQHGGLASKMFIDDSTEDKSEFPDTASAASDDWHRRLLAEFTQELDEHELPEDNGEARAKAEVAGVRAEAEMRLRRRKRIRTNVIWSFALVTFAFVIRALWTIS